LTKINILLFSKSGQVGWELRRSTSLIGQLAAHDRSTCDMTNLDELRNVIVAAKPNVIVNAAAYTAVDKAEQDPIAAFQINSEAVAVMAELATKSDALLTHYSTDYVFDGFKPSPYTESDKINPLSVYGKSKAQSEQVIINSGCRHLIFRTSWVFGAQGHNFTKTILELAGVRNTLRVVNDQIGAPTSAELIADVTAHAIRDILAGRAPGGLYHLAAAGETSWHGYANFVLEQARLLGIPLKTYNAEPISSSEYPLPAKRPANSRLDTTKLQTTFGLRMPDWRYHLARTVQELAERH